MSDKKFTDRSFLHGIHTETSLPKTTKFLYYSDCDGYPITLPGTTQADHGDW